jgi:hypothetical protein
VVRVGYVNHIIVDLDGVQITIERDEEGNYRALGDWEKMKDSKVEVDLIKEIIRVLESLQRLLKTFIRCNRRYRPKKRLSQK